MLSSTSNNKKDYLNDKLLPSEMKLCHICKSNSFHSKTLTFIKKINKIYTDFQTYRLGKRTLSDKYQYKYKEDESLRQKTDYINIDTSAPELWTICNCQIRVHPDCFLESFHVHMKYKCEICETYYKIGYVLNQNKVNYSNIIIIFTISLILIIIGIILLSRTTKNINIKHEIRIFRSIGLILIAIFLFLFILFIHNLKFLIQDNLNIKTYLLPYAYKYDLIYGIDKFKLKTLFKSLSEFMQSNGLPSKNKEASVFDKGNIQLTTQGNSSIRKETEEKFIYSISNRQNYPFLNKFQEDLNIIKIKNNGNINILSKRYIFNYNLTSDEIIIRAINLLKQYYKLNTIEELFDLKYERTYFINLIIGRDIKFKFQINEMKEEFSLEGDDLIVNEPVLKNASEMGLIPKYSSNVINSSNKRKIKKQKSGSTLIFKGNYLKSNLELSNLLKGRIKSNSQLPGLNSAIGYNKGYMNNLVGLANKNANYNNLYSTINKNRKNSLFINNNPVNKSYFKKSSTISNEFSRFGKGNNLKSTLNKTVKFQHKTGQKLSFDKKEILKNSINEYISHQHINSNHEDENENEIKLYSSEDDISHQDVTNKTSVVLKT